MRSSLPQWLARWIVLALGVMLAAKLVPGIRCDSGFALVCVVLVLSLVNAVLKPVLVLFTLPFILVTMGLGMVVINALLFLFAAWLVDGFHVAGFWSAAGGAIVVSATNFVAGRLFKPPPPPPRPPPAGPGEVIDV